MSRDVIVCRECLGRGLSVQWVQKPGDKQIIEVQELQECPECCGTGQHYD